MCLTYEPSSEPQVDSDRQWTKAERRCGNTHTHSHAHTHTLTHTPTHCHSHTHTLSRTHTLSLTHTHTHCAGGQRPAVDESRTGMRQTRPAAHTHTISRTHPHTVTHTLSLTHTPTHSHTHTHTVQVDSDRQWTKAERGCGNLDLPKELDRIISFDAHTILSDEVLVVLDTRTDPRFMYNHLVGRHQVRFYAGAPICLKRSGKVYRVGALSIMDLHPRENFGERSASLLRTLASGIYPLTV